MTQQEFEAVYRMYFEEVYHFLCSMTKDSLLAEELTSETFFRAMQHIDDFRGECKIESWLCQIAKNAYFSYLKKNHKTKTTAFSEKEPSNVPPNVPVEYQLEWKDTAMQIHKILHRLDEPYKEVFFASGAGRTEFPADWRTVRQDRKLGVCHLPSGKRKNAERNGGKRRWSVK